ncbi:GNAT family N-acetyltransferase, partial [Streptomyces sp. TRM76130]|nr:GNAT family N-acetyltransferase [Streptomyces sp. TRM76130]
MWENLARYPQYGYEVVERRVDGPYDRVHYRKRLSPPV